MRSILSFIIGFILALLFCILVFLNRPKVDTIIREAIPVVRLMEDNENLFDRKDIKFPNVAWAQLYLETGNRTSKVYKENGNFCGLKVRSSGGHAKGKKNGHADYGGDTNACVLDYAERIKEIQDVYTKETGKAILTDEDMIYALQHIPTPNSNKQLRWAEDPQYEQKLLKLLEKVRSVRNGLSNPIKQLN